MDMRTRPYAKRDGSKVWLERDETKQLLEIVEERPKRRIAFGLGFHGLRTDEIRNVEYRHLRPVTGGEAFVLEIPEAKRGARDVPINPDLQQRISMFKNATGMRQDLPLIDVSRKSIRNWIDDATDELGEEFRDVTMHDLRRTWATDTFYSLAFAGVPIAEELTMAWGGWAMTATGRETFRENYLGPVPDHITASAIEKAGLFG